MVDTEGQGSTSAHQPQTREFTGSSPARPTSMARAITRADIEAAAARIDAHVRTTPVIEVGHLLSDEYDLVLKLEHLQVTGSFKPRGAFSLLTSHQIGPAGIAAASGGNFGIAAAHAARRLGHRATIFVPDTSPEEKVGRIGAEGAEVRVVPGYYDEALGEARRFIAETGAFEAHAYDQAEVVAGQGTLGQEILGQVSGAVVVVVPVGGGGLIGGVASWCQGDVTLVAVEPERCASFNASLRAGRQVEVEVGGVAASSLGARTVGDHAWAARQWVAESILVTEDSIIEAQSWLWHELKLAVEPAAATTVAALRSGSFRPQTGDTVVVLLSGGNVDLATIA